MDGTIRGDISFLITARQNRRYLTEARGFISVGLAQFFAGDVQVLSRTADPNEAENSLQNVSISDDEGWHMLFVNQFNGRKYYRTVGNCRLRFIQLPLLNDVQMIGR
ncbi:hypothetical protein [Bacteroides acidifaciens]|uniref:hypothetical protein n=1 Tax=Bacteroides acidifaciens TaxID=85831 RepID=UPI003F68D748